MLTEGGNMNRIKELREQKYRTQTELAIAVGLARQNISKWENGKIGMSFKTIKKLAKFFKVTPDYLLNKKGE